MFKIRNAQGKWSNGKTPHCGLLWKDKGGKTWGSRQAIVGHLAYVAELSKRQRDGFIGCVVVEFSDSGAAPTEHDMMTWVQIYVDRRAAKKKDEASRRIKHEVSDAINAIESAKARLRRAKRKYEQHFGHAWEDRPR